MLRHGCVVLIYPKYNYQIDIIFKILLCPYVDSYVGKMKYELLKEQLLIDLSRKEQVYYGNI